MSTRDANLNEILNRDEAFLNEQPPVDFDTDLATLHIARESAVRGLQSAKFAVAREYDYFNSHLYARKISDEKLTEMIAALNDRLGDSLTEIKRDSITQALSNFDAASDRLNQVQEAIWSRDAVYYARGSWNRVFIADNRDGHAHSSMLCSTCNKGKSPTRFTWMPVWSDATEAQIVSDAGWRACTVCYPSAPVGDEHTLPTTIFTSDDYAKQQAKAEREAKRAATEDKQRANAATADGSVLEVTFYYVREGKAPVAERKSLKTERAAITWAVDTMLYELESSLYAGVQQALNIVYASVAEKRGVTADVVESEVKAKADKKR